MRAKLPGVRNADARVHTAVHTCANSRVHHTLTALRSCAGHGTMEPGSAHQGPVRAPEPRPYSAGVYMHGRHAWRLQGLTFIDLMDERMRIWKSRGDTAVRVRSMCAMMRMCGIPCSTASSRSRAVATSANAFSLRCSCRVLVWDTGRGARPALRPPTPLVANAAALDVEVEAADVSVTCKHGHM